MKRGQPITALALFAGLVVLAYGGLIGWLYYLQCVRHEEYTRLANGNIRVREIRPARRGMILDIHGNPLALSVPVKTVCVDPSLVFTRRALVARTLAPLLHLPLAEVTADITPRVHLNQDGQLRTNCFVILEHNVGMARWNAITQAMAHLQLGFHHVKKNSSLGYSIRALKHKAIFAIDSFERRYPNGSLAAHVIGYVRTKELDTPYGMTYTDRGLTGIELSFNRVLNGIYGWKTLDEDVAPHPGLNVVLTLDSTVQAIVESELHRAVQRFHPTAAWVIVVRPQNGAILALANWPDFDPNHPGRGGKGYFDWAVGAQLPPGSTFKIVTIGTALSDHLLRLNEIVFCENGIWRQAHPPLHDHRPFGYLTFEQVLEHSSNIGAAKAGARLGPQRLYNTITNFGFNAYTGIPLPAEEPGLIRRPSRHDASWISRVPMGQGVQATPIQMAMAMCAIANGGWLYRPMLVSRIVDNDGRTLRQFAPQRERRVISADASRQMVQALKTVTSEQGTARKAMMDDYDVAGKTGTAELDVHGTVKSGVFYASFIGFFPAENPAVCMIVGMDGMTRREPHQGGQVAAPTFKAIAERLASYLHIPPDHPTEPVAGPPAQPINQWARRSDYADNELRRAGPPLYQ